MEASIKDPYSDLSDWVERAKGGEVTAFEQVVKKSRKLVIKVALPLVERHQLEDVVQETYLKVHQHLHQLQKANSFVPWLARIAVNCCHRVRKKTPLVVESRETDQTVDPTSGLATKLDLRQALQELKEFDRNILVLRELLGLSYEEVAYALLLPVGTVRSRIHYARKKLKKRMSLEE